MGVAMRKELHLLEDCLYGSAIVLLSVGQLVRPVCPSKHPPQRVILSSMGERSERQEDHYGPVLLVFGYTKYT